MKVLQSITAILLALSLLGNVTFANDEIIEGNQNKYVSEYNKAVEFLLMIDVLRADANNKYPQEKMITRAEFADIVLKMIGFKNVEGDGVGLPYTDVRAWHWAADTIKYATELGYFSGLEDNTFRPDEGITLNEAIKVLVNVLGYEQYAIAKGGYPFGYSMVASELKIARKITFTGETKITKGMAALLVFNAIHADVMEQISYGKNDKYKITSDYNLLATTFGIYTGDGILTSAGIYSIDSEVALNHNQAIIDGHALYLSNVELFGFLGYWVDYYYTENSSGDNTIIYVSVKENKNDILTLHADEIVGYKNHTYKYIKDNTSKETNAAVSFSADVVYNGKPLFDYTESDFMIDEGKITLIDNNADGEYDVVSIAETKDYFVLSVDKEQGIIYDTYDNSKQLNFFDNEKDIHMSVMFADGAPATINSIAAMDIITATVSNDGTIVNMIISRNNFSGTVDEYSNTDKLQVVIDGVNYNIANGFAVKSRELIFVGSTGTFYLNSNGEIAAFDESYASSEKYAYIAEVKLNQTGINKKLEVKLFTEKGSMLIASCADKILVDTNHLKKPEDVSNAINAILLGSRFVRYSLDSEGCISTLDTITTNTQNPGYGLRRLYNSGNKIKYTNATSSFAGMLSIDSNVIVFLVPSNPNAANVTDDNYQISDKNYFNDGSTYAVDSYCSTPNSILPEIVVLYDVNVPSLGEATVVTFVEKVTKALDEDGMEVQLLYGYQKEKEVKIYATTASLFDNVKAANSDANLNKYKVEPGDLVRIGLNSKGVAEDVEILFDATDNTLMASNPNGVYDKRVRVIYGNVYLLDKGYMQITTSSLDESVNVSELSLECHNIKSIATYIYDKDNIREPVKKGTIDSFYDYVHNGSKYSKCVVHTRYGIPNLLVIYK